MAQKDATTVYTGMTWSPLGTLKADGLRLRSIGGVGFSHYSGERYDAATNRSVLERFKAQSSFGDALVGWHAQLGNLTLKTFGGATYETRVVRPQDDYATGLGQRWSYKVVAEAWLNVSPRIWLSLDTSASGIDAQRFAKLRLGYRLTEQLSLGVEGAGRQWIGLDGHGRATDVGAFLRFDTGRMELTVSGTQAVDAVDTTADRANRFKLNAQALVRF